MTPALNSLASTEIGVGGAELKWLPIPPDFWMPAGLKDFQEAWFINLVRASIKSKFMGYLILCEEGCRGCPACLWRVANAHHPEHFKKHSSLVLACFNSAQIAGHRVLYFSKLVETIKRQRARIKNHRSQRDILSETSTAANRGSGFCSPSQTLFFDFDSSSKTTHKNLTTRRTPETHVIETSQEPITEPHAQEDCEEMEPAKRILNILGLSEAFLSAATAAVETIREETDLSEDGIVRHIVTEANLIRRSGVPNEKFLDDFLARRSAQKMLDTLNLPISKSSITRTAAVVKAEAKDTGLTLQEAAHRIAQAACEDRRRGVRIDMFYFEDVKWRSNERTGKAEQRKLNNLEVNAKVKQRLREKLGAS